MEKLKIVVFLGLCLSSGIASAEDNMFNNNVPSFGNSSEKSYEYSYREHTKPLERPTDFRTGSKVNYYYIPQRPGARNCSRRDRNFVECK